MCKFNVRVNDVLRQTIVEQEVVRGIDLYRDSKMDLDDPTFALVLRVDRRLQIAPRLCVLRASSVDLDERHGNRDHWPVSLQHHSTNRYSPYHL